jgi:RHS repeat-associated protein
VSAALNLPVSRIVTDSYDYDAFGNKINSTGTTPNNYLYRGEFFDSDLGMYYLRARYYNPLTGRFMSRDPEAFCDCSIRNPLTLHKYIYGEDDPVDLADPSGRAPIAPAAPAAQSSTVGGPVEYALIIGDISLGAVAGSKALASEISCVFETAASLLHAVYQNLGLPQTVRIDGSTCSARSTTRKIPGTDIGPYPAPFYPDENWAMSPGNPWTCEADA